MVGDDKLVNLKILIIDDDEFIRIAIKNILKKVGPTLYEAADGRAGIELYKREKPDVVITDILMPDKEGLETITELRLINPCVKIIAISGGGYTQNMGFLQLAQKLGANRALSKPIKPDELLNCIRAI